MDQIYVFGHKSPDTDTVCSAIAYAKIKNFIPARLGELNEETAYVLNFFGVEKPEILIDAKGKKVVLVDHNEFSQSADGIAEAEILGVIDHHKINFSYNSPINFHSEPLGSTATVIAKKYFDKIKDSKIAGILLASILSDTVVFKSPTTTEEDKIIAEKLSKIAGIHDMIKFGIEIKKTKASISNKPIEAVIRSDFKDFDFHGKKVGIGQSELVDIEEAYKRRQEIMEYLNSIKAGYEMVVFIATDIIKEGSELFFVGDAGKIEKAFKKKISGNSVYLEGVMSRKKQVVPFMENVF